jgi:hypothetical protein
VSKPIFALRHETEKIVTLRNGNRSERSKFAAFHTPVLTRDVITRERLSEFRALGVEDLDLTHMLPGRVRALAWYAALSKAQGIQRPDERQIATLLAFARVYEPVAQGDAVDLLH